ncbi:MAG TPA: hypothetical protein VMR98_00150, partial [Candidatus Polarisedimenticolaceae bacterium]|nr:hypothetical protein [Candidatus Polarisedimenticolaceae bacterium]
MWSKRITKKGFVKLNTLARLAIAGLFVALLGFQVGGLAPEVRAAAGINQQINFQARLLNAQGATVPDGNYNIQFKIYQDGTGCVSGGSSPCGGTLLWTESWLNNNTQGITVKNGYFSVNLGAISSLSSVDFNQDTLWLSLNIGTTNGTCTPFTGCGGDGEMLPFKRFASNPYSLNSGKLGGLASSQFVQLAQGVQADSSTASSIFINKTGASGNLLQLQKAAADVLTVGLNGNLTMNTPSGFTGNFVDLKLNNSSKFSVTEAGNTTVGGTLTITGDVTAAGTVILSGLNTAGIVHTSATGQLSTSAIILGTDTSGSYVANLGTLTGLGVTGNSGGGSTPNLSVTYGSGSNTAVQGNTQISVGAGTGLSGGGTLTLGSGGTATLDLDIDGLTAKTAINSNDTLALYDTSSSSIKKITRSDFLQGLTGALQYRGT